MGNDISKAEDLKESIRDNFNYIKKLRERTKFRALPSFEDEYSGRYGAIKSEGTVSGEAKHQQFSSDIQPASGSGARRVYEASEEPYESVPGLPPRVPQSGSSAGTRADSSFSDPESSRRSTAADSFGSKSRRTRGRRDSLKRCSSQEAWMFIACFIVIVVFTVIIVQAMCNLIRHTSGEESCPPHRAPPPPPPPAPPRYCPSCTYPKPTVFNPSASEEQ